MKTIQQITSLRILSVLTVIISSFMMHGCAHYQPRGDAGAICPDGNPPFTFVVIGDTRPGMPAYPDDPGTPSIDYLEQIHWINRLNPDFTIVVGDLIRGYNSKHPGLLEQQWDGFDETVSLYKTPLYMVVGNHDVWDDYSDKIYQQRYGPQYFSFDHKKCHFIVLSADIPYKLNKIDQTQIKWLKEDLISSKDALHKFVFLHKPIWLPDYIGNTVWLSTIHELFKKHNVDAVFAGHEHHYEPFLIDNIPYFITGGGGAEIGGRKNLGDFFHFISVSIPSEGEPSLKIIKKTETLPTTDVPVGLRRMVMGIEEKLREQPAIVMGTKERKKISFTVKNLLSDSAELNIAWLFAEKGAVNVDPSEQNIKLAIGEEKDFSFTVTPPQTPSEIPRIKWEITVKGTKLSDGIITPPVARLACYTEENNTQEDSTCQLLLQEKRQVVIGAKHWQGPTDCSAVATIKRKENGIGIVVDVTDDMLVAKTSAHYQNDSVEFYFDVRDEKRGIGGDYDLEGGVFQASVLPFFSGNDPDTLRFGPYGKKSEVPGATVETRIVEGTGYRVEVFLPYDGLSVNHRIPDGDFNIDIGINDADAGGSRETQLMWSGTRDNWRSPLCFGRIRKK